MPTSKKTSSKKVKTQEKVPEAAPAPSDIQYESEKKAVPQQAPTSNVAPSAYKVIGNVMHDGVSLHVGDVVTDPELIHALLPQGLITKL